MTNTELDQLTNYDLALTCHTGYRAQGHLPVHYVARATHAPEWHSWPVPVSFGWLGWNTAKQGGRG